METNMSEVFDIGPLSWVKDEIDQSLKKVIDGYIVVIEHPKDYESLRFTLAHLYQVGGALDMVGLEGCKRYCSEIERLTSKVEKGLVPATNQIMEDLMFAVQTLSQYLQDLLNGLPDTPLRLYDSLKHLHELQGETLEVTDLFYPDTSFSPPSDLPANPIAESALPVFVAEQRAVFQKSLLEWLMTKDATALESMKNSLFNVQKVQQKKSQKSLWWAATAFTEALAQDKVSALSGAKKLCRKLDQQLRNMSLGEAKVPSHLLRDVLYYVAISDRNSEHIARVKDVFELDAVLPSSRQVQKEISVLTDAERAAIAQLIAELPSLKELWVGVSEYISDDIAQTGLVKEFPLEELQGFTIKLQFLLENMQNHGVNQGNPNNQDLIALMQVTQKVSQKLLGEIDRLNEAAILEVATALNLLEAMAEQYAQLSSDVHQKVIVQINRLQQVIEAHVPANLARAAAQAVTQPSVDDSVTMAVATQIINALHEVEKSIDGFFRTPSLTIGLDEAIKPLTQVSAAFDMLEMPTPKTIAKLAIFYVEQFKNNAPKYATPHPNYDQFNVFAEALSLLGLYAQDLPEVRTESKHALSECLKQLEAGVDALDVLYDAEIEEVVTGKRSRTDENTSSQAAAVTAAVVDEDAHADYVEIARFADADVLDKAIDLELQEIFVTEAEEVLANNTLNLQALRENDANNIALTEIRRAFHTLKGSGRTVGLEAMGDVAHALEKLLNVVIEHKTVPTPEILDFAEHTNAAFSVWIEQLKTEHEVVLNPGQLQQQAADMALVLENVLMSAKPKARKEEVLIGGSRKVGRAFFYLFLGEAQLHLNTLTEAQKAIKSMSMDAPTSASCRAAHTLSSNALTAGFETIGDLARALEHWLDEFTGAWTDKHLALYAKVNDALAEGLEKAKNLQNPKSTRALIIELSKSTASMQVLAAQQAEMTVQTIGSQALESQQIALKELSDHELLGSALSESELTLAGDEDFPEFIAENAPVMEVSFLDATDNEPQVAAPLSSLVENPRKDAEDTLLQAPHIALQSTDKPQDIQSIPADSTLVDHVYSVPEHGLTQEKPSLAQTVATEIDQELLGLFIEEASELVPEIGRSLRSWKNAPNDAMHPDALQRALHTLKGSARTAGQAEIGDRVHELEDRVVQVLQHRPTLDDFDDMFIEFDRISFMLDDLLKKPVVDEDFSLEEDVDSVQFLQPIEHSQELPAASAELSGQFLRVRSAMLDQLINEAGEVSILRSRMDREMQGFKQSSVDLTLSVGRLRTYLQELEVEAETQLQSQMNVLQESNPAFDPLELDRYTRLQELTRLMAESLSDITTIQQGLVSHIDQTDVALQQQNRMNRELQKGLMTVRMMPFSSISERLHRIVRQISRELNKRVELTIEGEEIELDRSVLDKVGAPLEHLLRNAVAHGLETTKERIQSAKSPTGQIKLKVSVENDEITLMVSDDGRGVDLQKVKKIAIEKGLLTENQTINDQTLIAIIFESGFSTVDTVSKIAGRGVGLDAVRSDIAALNGRIDVSNMPGAGAVFNIYLPVTLSVTQVVVVRVAEQQFAIPSVMVEQVQTLKQQDLMDAYDQQKVVWSAHDYPIYFLARLIGNTDYTPKTLAYTPVVLLRSGQYRTALHVDEVVGNQEVVMKSMGTQLTRVPGIVGATVMGDGAIVFVMNPVQLAHREALTVGAIKVTTFAPVEQAKKMALVVDDSLTMRKVLARILEREGFEVVTANDGVDAIQKLQDMTPDIILTDIEMPRMDGFEFSWHVRDTPKTAKIPLIMISSRTAQKHRTIADEIGVNAFLGKPVQDEALMAEVNALLNKKPTSLIPLIQTTPPDLE
jgi:chemosensory pili system protein ChpA (sensor histidine kinase/response regulator)